MQWKNTICLRFSLHFVSLVLKRWPWSVMKWWWHSETQLGLQPGNATLFIYPSIYLFIYLLGVTVNISLNSMQKMIITTSVWWAASCAEWKRRVKREADVESGMGQMLLEMTWGNSSLIEMHRFSLLPAASWEKGPHRCTASCNYQQEDMHPGKVNEYRLCLLFIFIFPLPHHLPALNVRCNRNGLCVDFVRT